MVLGAMISIQTGAAVATGLFDEIGSLGVVFIRALASGLLLAALWRPGLRDLKEDRGLTLLFGLALGGMNLCFYEAIDRVHLGTAVTLEFIGPLAVALATSHRRRDWIWAAMGFAGVVLLGGGVGSEGLDPLGVLFSFAAGGFWGWYILLGRRVGQASSGGKGLAVAMLFSAVITAPFGVASGGVDLVRPEILAFGLVIGLLGSALPFSLELEAMRRVRSNVFGVLMSLEPAVATVVGFVLLSQAIGAVQAVAILLVVAASAGALYTGRGPAPIEP